MAEATKKKSYSSWKNRPTEEDTNNGLLLAEERRLAKKPFTKQAPKKDITKFNTLVNQMTSEQIDKELEKRQLSISGEIEIRRIRLKHHHNSDLVLEHDNPSKIIKQNFEYIAVVDFEATCEEHQGNNYQHEIIEFPIVLINVQEQTIVEKFQSYCRPIKKPILSKFCTDLTGIEQHQVKNAPLFPEVLHNVETWLNERNLLSSTNKSRLAFATDGPWDFANFLRMQCEFSSIPYPQWAQQWINIRKEFSNFYGVRRCGIPKMLGKLGLNFDGRRHSGLDDAVNIARIAIELLKDGCVLSLNDGIRGSDPTEEKIESKNKETEEDSILFQD